MDNPNSFDWGDTYGPIPGVQDVLNDSSLVNAETNLNYVTTSEAKMENIMTDSQGDFINI
jgi:hypothetical protein